MITPIQANYTYYRYTNNTNKKENISFGAVPRMRSKLAENKKITGSLAGAIAATFALIAQIYGKARSQEEPVLVSGNEFADILGISKKKFTDMKYEGYIVKSKEGKKLYDLNNEQNKKTLYRALGRTITKVEIAKLTNTNPNTILYHINQGRIKVNEEGLVDLKDPTNRYFLENYEGYNVKSIPITENEFPEIMNSISMDYCIERGLLVLDEKGKVDLTNTENQKFLRKCKDGRVSVRDYILSVESFCIKAHKGKKKIRKDIEKGNVVLTEDGRVDILDPVNAKYIADNIHRERNKNHENKLTITQVCRLLGLNTTNALRYHVSKGNLVRDEKGLIDITKEPNKTFLNKKLTHVPKSSGYKRK